MLSGIDSSKLTAQLKLLGQQDKATLDKMVYFLKAVSVPLLETACWLNVLDAVSSWSYTRSADSGSTLVGNSISRQ